MNIIIRDYLIDKKSCLLYQVGSKIALKYFFDIFKEVSGKVLKIAGAYNEDIKRLALSNNIKTEFIGFDDINESEIILEGNCFYNVRRSVKMIKKGKRNFSKAVLWKIETKEDFVRAYMMLSARKQHAPYGYVFLKLGYFFAWFLKFTPITPNQVTMLSLFAAIATALCFASKQYEFMLLGVCFLFIHAALDISDGHLARIKHMESSFGKWFDSVIGRINPNVIYLGVAYGLNIKYSNPLFILSGAILVMLDLMLDYIFLIDQPESNTSDNKTEKREEKVSLFLRVHRIFFRWETKFLLFALFAALNRIEIVFSFYLLYFFLLFIYQMLRFHKTYYLKNRI